MRRHLFALALVPLTGCQHASTQPPATASDALVLRTYDMPKGYGKTLPSVLNGLLRRGKDKPAAGRAALSPDGSLLVFAPAGVQLGVKRFADNVRHRNKPIATAPTIKMDHWVLMAHPHKPDGGPDKCGVHGLSCLSDGSGVRQALETMRKSQGKLGRDTYYTEVEHVLLRSVARDSARMNGKTVKIRQNVTQVGKHILADISYHLTTRHGPSMSTRLSFAPHQTVVLGEMDAPSGMSAEEPSGQSRLLFIAQATLEK